MKPIQTRYAGCHFRSRLEARWAVFFDALGIGWEYEPEGFRTTHGPYLPDFYLPEINCLVEIKPRLGGVLNDPYDPFGHTISEPIEAAKIREASAQHDQEPVPVLLVGNVGDEKVFVYLNDQTDGSAGEGWWQSRWNDVSYIEPDGKTTHITFVPFFDDERRTDGSFKRAFCNPFNWSSIIRDAPDGWSVAMGSWSPATVLCVSRFARKGYDAARSARFEHGETP